MSDLDLLMALPRFADRGAAAYRPGLARMEALLAAMGRPHEAYPTVHVAGTNGKGSTASLVAAVGTAAGRRVGLHTSPHLLDVTERMRIDGVPAPADWLADAVSRHRAPFEEIGPSFFEATVALSLLYFADAGVDLAVVEVGLGGRLDATNVLRPRLALITSIALDHTDLLGDTIAAIAGEKAGIVKPGVPVMTSAEAPEAVAVIEAAAAAVAAPFHHVAQETAVEALDVDADAVTLTVSTPHRRYADLRVGLGGQHAATNARLALRASEALWPELVSAPAPLYAGFAEVRRLAGLRGRLEVLRRAPVVLADVAHNPGGLAAALGHAARVRPADGRLFVLLGVMADKDVAAMAQAVAGVGAAAWAAALPGDRAAPADVVAAHLEAAGVPLVGRGPVAEGLAALTARAAEEDVILAAGSHLVVEAALRAVSG